MIEKIKKIFLGENKYRMIIFLFMLVFAILFYFTSFLRYPNFINNLWLCNNNGLCEFFWSRDIAWPLYSFLPYLFISTFLLLFFSKNTFKLWAKIMVPVFIVSLIITITTPDICSGMICFDRTLVASGFAKLFLIFTVLIIFIKLTYDLIISKRNKK